MTTATTAPRPAHPCTSDAPGGHCWACHRPEFHPSYRPDETYDHGEQGPAGPIVVVVSGHRRRP